MSSYTHYWSTGPKTTDPKLWYQYCTHVSVLLREFKGLYDTHSLQVSSAGQRIVAFRPAVPIAFGEFEITATSSPFVFCRTNRRSYDTLVTSCLLTAKVVFSSWIKLTSDGKWDEWEPAREACKSHLGFVDSQFQIAKIDFDELLD